MKILIKNIYFLISIWALLSGSCAKNKVDKPLLYTQSPFKTSNSSIRLIALFGSVSANINGVNVNLSPNFIPKFRQSSFSPSPYFIPNTALDANGKVKITFTISTGQNYRTPGANQQTYSFTKIFTPDPKNPTDYYISLCNPEYENYGRCSNTEPVFTAVLRPNNPPPSPDRFLIRVLDLTPKGIPEDVFSGPYTLSFSDGTYVSPFTQNIDSIGSYTDLPYGCYQFKVFNNRYVQLLEGSNLKTNGWNYEPGGIYTLVIYNDDNFLYSFNDFEHENAVNAFNIISDLVPPPNQSFAKIKFINAIPNSTLLALQVDGEVLDKPVAFTVATEDRVVSTGLHTLVFQDSAGETITQPLQLFPYDNISVFAYLKNGKPSLCISPQNFDSIRSTFLKLQIRFLNLSTDIPSITYELENQLFPDPKTNLVPNYNDSSSSARATQNLLQGYVATHLPYVYIDIGSNFQSYGINVYQSDPNPPVIIPGILLNTIQPLDSSNFIANPNIYKEGIFQVPQPGLVYPVYLNGEPGVYTVALMGSLGSTNSAYKARMVVIKHNR